MGLLLSIGGIKPAKCIDYITSVENIADTGDCNFTLFI
jgi:hypothetical protein